MYDEGRRRPSSSNKDQSNLVGMFPFFKKNLVGLFQFPAQRYVDAFPADDDCTRTPTRYFLSQIGAFGACMYSRGCVARPYPHASEISHLATLSSPAAVVCCEIFALGACPESSEARAVDMCARTRQSGYVDFLLMMSSG